MQALEDKILADPDDWDSWLVYGDWLIERGDPRGEMIGLEHRLRTRPMPAAERAPLVARLQEQQTLHEDRWFADKGRVSGLRLRWRAGFVLDVELWTWWGDRDKLAVVEALADEPAGRLLRKLVVKSHCGLGGFDALAKSPVLARVRDLVLSDVGMGSGSYDGIPGRHGLDLVVASPHLQKIASLDISANDLRADAAASFSSSSGAPPTFEVEFSDDKGEVLARLPSLSALNLRRCSLGDAALGSLVGPRGLPGLTRLDLGANRLTAEGIRTLAGSDRLGTLRSLVLRDNDLGLEGFEALADARGLGSLESLDLAFTLSDRAEAEPGDGDRVAPILARAQGLSGLRELDLRGLGLSEEGRAVLTASETFRNCVILS